MGAGKFLPVLALLLMRLLLGGVFAYAGFAKLMEPPENFQASMAEYGLLPSALLPALSYTLPWLEWLLGMFVLTGFGLRASAGMLGAASAAFAILIAASGKLFAGGQCGCFGEGGLQLTVPQMFSLDLVNAISGTVLFRVKDAPLTLDRLLRKRA